jgi:hypothetical protein
LSAFIGGRSSLIVPIPSEHSRRMNSPMLSSSPSPGRCSASLRWTAVTTYYRDDRIQITSSAVRIDGQTFLLGDLEYVWHRRGTADLTAVLRRLARWGLFLLAAVIGLACAVKTPALLRFGAGGPDILVRLAFVLAGSFALLAIGWPLMELVLSGLDHVYSRGVVVQEIWADWRGRDILLLRCSDQMRFGQIYRALQRAVENRTD